MKEKTPEIAQIQIPAMAIIPPEPPMFCVVFATTAPAVVPQPVNQPK